MDVIITTLRIAHWQFEAASSAFDACPDAALIAWEHEILTISASCVIHMRRLRNSRAAINRLPDELLAEIFLAVSDASFVVTEWLPVSQVCCHWRTVALATPPLWSAINIDFRDPFIELLLQRSGGTALSVRDKFDMHVDYESFCKLFSPHAQRIRSLEIRGYDAINVMHALGPTLLTLDTLRISESAPEDRGASDEFCLPRLRAVWARDVHFSYLSPWLRSLRVLHLSHVGSIPSLSSLLDVLEACPFLKDIGFRASLAWSTNLDDLDDPRVVALPRVATLEIEEYATPQVGALCSHLALPTDTVVHLNLTLLLENPSLDQTFLPQNTAHWPVLAETRLIELEVLQDTLTVELARVPSWEDSSLAPPHVYLQFDAEELGFPITTVLAQVLEHLATSLASPRVVQLVVRTRAPGPEAPDLLGLHDGARARFPEGLWPRLFARFPSLQSVELDGTQEIQPVFEALGSGEGPSSLPCADLRELRVNGSTLDGPAIDAVGDMLSCRAARDGKLADLRESGVSVNSPGERAIEVVWKQGGAPLVDRQPVWTAF